MAIIFNNTSFIPGAFREEKKFLRQQVGRLQLSDAKGEVGQIKAVKIDEGSFVSSLLKLPLFTRLFFGDFETVMTEDSTYLVSRRSGQRAVVQTKILRQIEQCDKPKLRETLDKIKEHLLSDKMPLEKLLFGKATAFHAEGTSRCPEFILRGKENPELLVPTKTLGRGGFKDVKKAVNISTNSKHAIALVRSNNFFVRYLTNRERSFYETLKQKNISHIVGLDSLDKDQNDKMIGVMPYCKGKSLDRHLHTLSHKDKVALFARLAQILADLHRNGVVHRDIKPENFLVNGDKVSLGDFGLVANQSEIKVGGGTRNYMPPEKPPLFGILGPVRSTQDAWAFGVMLCEAFFKPEANVDLFVRQVSRRMNTQVADRVKDADVRVQQAIIWLLQVNPKERMTLQQAANLLSANLG